MTDAITSAQIAKTNRKLETLAAELKHPIDANRAASVALYGWVIDNFDSEGGKVGGWAPLSAARIRYKEQIGKEKMLVITGQLRAGFVPGFSESNAWVVNRVPYAKPLNDGTNRGLPARRMMPNRKEVLDIGIKVYKFYVSKSVGRAK